MPPTKVLNQWRVAHGYAAAEAQASSLRKDGAGLRLRVIIPINSMNQFSPLLGVAPDSQWLQVIQAVPEQIAHNANLVQKLARDYPDGAAFDEDYPVAFGSARAFLAHLKGIGATVGVEGRPPDRKRGGWGKGVS